MRRIDRVFKQLKAKGEKALIPFITAGDPDLATTRALALEIAARMAEEDSKSDEKVGTKHE